MFYSYFPQKYFSTASPTRKTKREDTLCCRAALMRHKLLSARPYREVSCKRIAIARNSPMAKCWVRAASGQGEYQGSQ